MLSNWGSRPGFLWGYKQIRKGNMSQPQAITAVEFVLSDGSTVIFDQDQMEPGAYYSVSRNFNNPPRKATKGDPKQIAETWMQHSIHFITDRETKDIWQQRTLSE